MITVSLVEDDAVCRGFLSRSLRSFKQVRLLGAHATGEAALERLPLEKPSVALMDIKLPGVNGIECVRRLRGLEPKLPTHFIMLTGHNERDLLFNSLRVGARGYLLKEHITRQTLLLAIKEVMGDGSPLSPSVARQLVAYFEKEPPAAISLPSREREVLQLLARGLMYKEISGELSVTVNTIRKFAVSIYHKLDVHSRGDAIQRAHDRHWL
jgi:DNA-binding NarL/FixJ family response regulator